MSKTVQPGLEADDASQEVLASVFGEEDTDDEFGFGEDFDNDVRSDLDSYLKAEEDLTSITEEEEDEVLEEEGVIEEEVLEDEEVEGEEPAGETEDEEDTFYDPERDAADQQDTAPNVFKDRVSANLGLVSKGSYMKKLAQKLEEVGGSIGALELPDVLGGDADQLDDAFSVDKVSTLSDEEARKAITQADQFINRMKRKIERIETVKNQEAEQQGYQKEIQDSAKQVAEILTEFGFTRSEIQSIKSDADVFTRIDGEVQKLEEGAEDFIQENGYKAFRDKLDGLRGQRDKLEELTNRIAKAQEAQQSKAAGQKEVTPEMVASAIEEFKLDRPDSWVFKDETGVTLESLVATANRRGWEMATAADWVRNAAEFKKIIDGMVTKKAVEQQSKPAQPKKRGIKKGKAPRVASRSPKQDEPMDTFFDRDFDDELREAFS